MKYGIFAILDTRAKSFGPPMMLPTDVHAVRTFAAEVTNGDKNSAIAQYPADFELHKIGTAIIDCDEHGNIVSNLSHADETRIVTGQAIANQHAAPGNTGGPPRGDAVHGANTTGEVRRHG